jgi:hypothetical protein
MYCISDRQIDFILNDIRRNGIVLEDLQLNLLDHVCCIIEQELEENGDFEQFYFTVIRRFYKNHLGEIEDETQSLLTFKHYYFMKKAMIVSGTAAALILSFGIVLKFLHMPGANISIILGIFLFCLVFLPLMATLRIKEKPGLRDRVLLLVGCLAAIGVCFAILFKLQHWPGANMLGLTSMGILVLVYLPVSFITGIRQPETKVNTIVSSVILVAGCGLFLSLARTPRATIKMNTTFTNYYLRNEQLLKHERALLTQKPADTMEQFYVLSNSIDAACEELKQMIIERETGFRQISGQTGVLLDEESCNLFSVNPEAEPLTASLEQAIDAYNGMSKGSALQALPYDFPFLADRNDRVLPALNDLVQVQMAVLQNLRTKGY